MVRNRLYFSFLFSSTSSGLERRQATPCAEVAGATDSDQGVGESCEALPQSTEEDLSGPAAPQWGQCRHGGCHSLSATVHWHILVLRPVPSLFSTIA